MRDATIEAALAAGGTLPAEVALALADGAEGRWLRPLLRAASALRGRHRPPVITFSPKVFLPLTNLCRDRCAYCSYRRAPGDPGVWTMTRDEVRRVIAAGRSAGCGEALICLGDRPEAGFPGYRRALAERGFDSTVSFIAWACAEALAAGLLPHTNAGLLSGAEMARLRPLNASLGLMLESASPRLCAPGGPHHRAPDKRPGPRLAMIRAAGALRIPFTSGILVGIGETPRERVEALLALGRLHARHGHLQEVIVQPFAPRPGIPMAATPAPAPETLASAVALARLLLPPEVSVQAPPNLAGDALPLLIEAGIDDLGGISPRVTPDYISPAHAWPDLTRLARRLASHGLALRPRLPVYGRFLEADGWVDPAVAALARGIAGRLVGAGGSFGPPRSAADAPAPPPRAGVAAP